MKTFSFNLLVVVLNTTSLTYAAEHKAVKLQALDADFLLFIAQMEKVEQGWIDPLTLENISFKPITKSEQSSKDMNTKNITTKTSKAVKQPNNKGAK